MKRLEETDMIKIKKGDNTPLSFIFNQCYNKSLKSIINTMRCEQVDAEDALMDSIISLRDAIVDDLFRNENVVGYLTIVAINKLKNKNKKDYRIEFLGEEALILKSGETATIEEAQNPKVTEILRSINLLKSRCKNLLFRNLVEGASLSSLASELGYNSYDVVKTSKARCMAKLRGILETGHQNI